MELGQFLQFLDDWLGTDHELSTSLVRFVGVNGYGLETLRGDLARFMFLPGLIPANPASSARGTFSPAELAEILSVRLLSPGKRDYVEPSQEHSLQVG